MFSGRFVYNFDLNENEVLNPCDLYPADVTKTETYWLWARNNKYKNEDYDVEKIGKWMLFLTRETVNGVWDKIKQAVTNGDLWTAKVSTCSPGNVRETHAVMIYTKDYTDKNDVINVLNFLESSGIASPQTIIRYNTDQQTRANIYSGGGQKPWIYASNTIRESD